MKLKIENNRIQSKSLKIYLIHPVFLNFMYLYNTMDDIYDIAIIGAGPAGLCAARNILLNEKNTSVIIIEKSTDINKRIPCAEGVGKLGFHEVLEPKKTWIRSEVSHLTLHSPDNTTITYTDSNKGYIINRALMQHDLADSCLDMGATGLFNHSVTMLSEPIPEGMRTIHIDNGSKVSAKVVIDCSGPLSRFGKNENIETKPLDLEAAYFAHVDGVKTRTDTVHLYVGKNLAPGGYAWAFPRNSESLNIGIVLGSSFRGKYNIGKLLNTFINKYYSEGTIVRKCAGSIPCYKRRALIATSRLIKAGDAISTVNPVSRAGISEAMKSGHLAGRFAIEMLGARSEKEMKKVCDDYEKMWHKKLGKRHLKLAKVKKSLLSVSDEEYNSGSHALAAIPQNKLTMSKIFTTCLGKFPKLVWALRHLM